MRHCTERGRREERFERLGPPGPRHFMPWPLVIVSDVVDLARGRLPLPWLGALGVAAFLALYVAAILDGLDEERRHTRRPLYLLGGMAAVTYALTIGYGGDWLLCFPLLSLATGVVLRTGPRLGAALGTLGITVGATMAVQSHTDNVLVVAWGTGLSGMVAAAVLNLSETNAKLRATREELAHSAVERERLRFSRDLHDLLGHTMSVIVVKAEAVRRLAPRDLEAAMGQAADIEAVGRQALTEIREAVTGYREGSLTTELDRARSLLEASCVSADIRQSGPPLPPQTAALLGWVVREGVTNVVRHSGAGRCLIEVRGEQDRVHLEISDDGRGVGSAQGDPGTGGNGLKGLGERLAAAGGSLTAGPDGRRGFRLVAELPVDDNEEERAA
ncbi:sensor histidine kinase [Streptomyces cinnamoneus]|uniref:Sensor histidine kinase n=1 Tax=Streptomyces cinnamoneus TaxID=53446 RepID=A0A2G1XGB1_STRCJ|nr:sensor histidine kinase [Streptomyces cinnamoneus]PHQ50245.1 sensor histidine kinase [Streptomyces cinnamoneus]PPT12970.1 sensor histidine kinase [Streptomyces cinnamoneus]